MSSMLLRTFQVLLATLLIALAPIGSLWVLGFIDVAEAKTSMRQIGGVLGICLITGLIMVGVFSIGGKKEP